MMHLKQFLIGVLAVIVGFLFSLYLAKKIDQDRPDGSKLFPAWYSV